MSSSLLSLLWWVAIGLFFFWMMSRGGCGSDNGDDDSDALDLYRKLEEKTVPMFYEHRDAWLRVMKQAIAINASFFNTHRMVRQYVDHAYASEDGVTRV